MNQSIVKSTPLSSEKSIRIAKNAGNLFIIRARKNRMNLLQTSSPKGSSARNRRPGLPGVRLLLTFGAVLLVAAGCNLPSANIAAPTAVIGTEALAETDLMSTAQAQVLSELPTQEPPTPTPGPTETAAPPTADPNQKPPELPEIFVSELLNPLDVPHTYEKDVCTFLKNRWDAGKAAPGTAVMVVMYHSIVKGDDSSVSFDNQVTAEKHNQFMEDLKAQGFETIDMTQFVNFMYNNDYIPERSALIISDDRHREGYWRDHFKPYYEKYGWRVVNGWISAPDTGADLWAENQKVEQEGYVDHQAHGVIHNITMSDASTDEFLYGELQGSVDKIQEYFGKKPIGIIWPGGNFGFRPIEIAKEAGYKVGFTVNPRGPVMYNWVPLVDESDPTRPSFLPDGKQDPLFVIPRYWNTDGSYHIDTVRQLSKAAQDYIYANRETEIAYYNIVCAPSSGPLKETP